MSTILIAGATGLIGSTALRLALNDVRFGQVIVLARRPLGLTHPKLTEWTHPELLKGLRNERVGAAVSCLGTTIRNVGGDQTKFIHVDKDLVVGLARWARDQGVPVMCVVSAIGADAGSRIFYNRVKGEMEREVAAIGLPATHFFQPSILTGPRMEKRGSERIGIAVMKTIAPLLPQRYRPMSHEVLAKALLHATQLPQGGTYTYPEIRAMAQVRN